MKKTLVFVVLLGLLASIAVANNSFYLVSPDIRACAAPLCGGYFVRPLSDSSDSSGTYVSSLDFSTSNITADGFQYNTSIITNAAPRDLILYGKIGPTEGTFELHKFDVVSAYVAIQSTATPTLSSSHKKKKAVGDYFQVGQLLTASVCKKTKSSACFSSLSLTTEQTESLRKVKIQISGVFEDTAWFNYLVTSGSISYGSLKTDSLSVSNIFIQIPQPNCIPTPHAFCPDGTVSAFTRQPDRCLTFTGCAQPGICPLFIPACGHGFTIVAIPQLSGGCPAFYCDPDFLPIITD